MRILYLDLDALTPSHLSCYGYSRTTSPNIDALAARGTRCTNVYAADAPCLPSRTGFYSGRFGIQTGVVNHGGRAAQPKIEGSGRGFRDAFDTDGLAGRLQQAGFHTAMVSPFGQRHAAWHFYAGFNEIHNSGLGGMDAVEDTMPTLERWLDGNAERDRWYLHVNFWDIHTPYRWPESYGNQFEHDPLPAWMDQAFLDRWISKTGPHSPLDVGMYIDGTYDGRFPLEPERIDTLERLKQYIDGYDTAIRYVDDQVGRVLERLEAAGVLDDTLVIVSADHGENQGELGIFGEHGTADQGTCNIPMVVAGPGVAAGRVDDALHYQLDLAPTLLEMLGREVPEIYDGRSYLGRLTEQGGDTADHEELVVSQCSHVCQRSVRFNDAGHAWLYIRTYHDGLHLFPNEMLFDLNVDPHEQNDVAADHPAVLREAAYRLMAWHDAQMHKMPQDKVDPLWTVIQEGGPFHARVDGSSNQPPSLKGYVERLESTGRAEGAAVLRERYPAWV